MAKVYPNGLADVNHFHAAGGLQFLIGELSGCGPACTPMPRPSLGDGLAAYRQEPMLTAGRLAWRDGAKESLNDRIVRPAADALRGDKAG